MRLAAAIALLPCFIAGEAVAALNDDILGLTDGKRVKIVWSHDTSAASDHVFGEANDFELHGYDTNGNSFSVIRSSLDDYSKPLITPDGARVIYTDQLDTDIYIINWDGSGRSLLKDASLGLVVWQDTGGKVWLYYNTNESTPRLRRFNIDNPSEDQLVWSQTESGSYGSISSDGTKLGGCWPWPQCGVITPNYDGNGGGSIRYPPNGHYITGCWSVITPDNTYRFGVFDSPHKAWRVWDWSNTTGSYRLVDLHSAPGIGEWEVYHPVFSNHPRFVLMTGPYSNGPLGANNIIEAGPQIEVYFGKIDAGFTQVTDWIQITNDTIDRADIYPMAWIDPGNTVQVRINSFNAAPSVIAEGTSATLTWSTTDADSVSIDQGVGAVAVNGSTTVSPTATTTYTLTAQGPGGPATRTVTVTVWPAASLHLKFNSGDGTPAVSGWDDPLPFVTAGGITYDFSGAVDLNGQTDPAPADVYATCIHLDHAYDFPVPDGTYRVRLHFYDQLGVGRAMDYTIEGTLVIDDLDIVAAAGGAERALILEFIVAVNDGNGMTIVADMDQGNDAFETGIEIISFDGGDTADPSITILEPSNGATVSGDFTVRGTAADDLVLSSVEIQVDGGTPETASGTENWIRLLSSASVGNGAHTITATAWDMAGKSTSASVDITVDTSQSITILSPAGGEEWAAGSTQLIEWSTVNLDNVAITYSLDGGTTYTQLAQTIQDTDAGWGAYSWQLPDVPTDNAVIGIKGYFGEAPAYSQPFRIVGEAIAIEVLQPAAGDVLHGGQQTEIVWSAAKPMAVMVEYSIDLGETWHLIDTMLADNPTWGRLSWAVPNVGSHLGLVRIFASEETWATGGPFVIEPAEVPAGALEVTTLVLDGVTAHGVQTLEVSGAELPVDGNTYHAEVALPSCVDAVMVELLADDGSSRRIKIELEDTGPPVPGLDVSAEELRGFVGGRGGVLVWVTSDGTLETVDFRDAAPQVRALSTDDQCINPLLSPDGTRVVYSRGAAGGSKQIRVRNLTDDSTGDVGTGDVGYWHVDGAHEYIVYAEWSAKADNGAGAATRRQKIVGVSPDGAATQLHDRAMDAGPNGELTWLGQVYGNLWAYHVATATEYPTDRFFLLDGSVADHQTCNGSMAPDGSVRLMTLVIPHDFVRVFTFDSASDSFRQTSELQLPPGWAEWEFPEWSTDAGLFTAVLIGSDGNNRLTLVKMAEGARVPEYLEIKSDDPRLTYSHLYVEP